MFFATPHGEQVVEDLMWGKVTFSSIRHSFLRGDWAEARSLIMRVLDTQGVTLRNRLSRGLRTHCSLSPSSSREGSVIFPSPLNTANTNGWMDCYLGHLIK